MKPEMNVWAVPGFERRRLIIYTALLYQHLQQLGVKISDSSTVLRGDFFSKNFDIFHVHWPEMAYQFAPLGKRSFHALSFLLKTILLKLKGTKIVWTVHNLRPHDKHPNMLVIPFFKIWSKLVDGIILLSESTQESVYSVYPSLRKKPCLITPQGHYRHLFELPPKKSQGSDSEDFHLVYFGLIRNYKNIDTLVSEFSKIDNVKLKLKVVGHCQDDELAKRLRSAAEKDRRIALRLEEIPESEIPQLMTEADLVVLPFKSILNSASAMLALSCNRPILLPNMGSLKEYQSVVGADWVQLYKGDITAEILCDAIEVRKRTTLNQAADLSFFDWEPIALKTKNFYESLVER